MNRGRPRPRRHRAEVEVKRLGPSSSLYCLSPRRSCCGCSCSWEKRKNHVQASSVDLASCAPVSFHGRCVPSPQVSRPNLPVPPKYRLLTTVPSLCIYLEYFRFVLWLVSGPRSGRTGCAESNYIIKEEKLTWRSYCFFFTTSLIAFYLRECLGGFNVAGFLDSTIVARQQW